MQLTLSNQQTFSLVYPEDLAVIEKHPLTEEESTLLHFIKDWLSDKTTFVFQTSGSTGAPKSILLERKLLIYSATQTLSALRLHNESQTMRFLLCLSPKFIGGAMVFVRAWVANGHLTVIPSTDSFVSLVGSYDLSSIAPIQAEKIWANPAVMNQLKNVLIGGAPLSLALEEKLTDSLHKDQKWYATYGMTETASHVAIRKIGSEVFEAIGDVVFSQDNRDCLKMKGTITNQRWLTTNDLVDLQNEKGFIWKGRYDFIINTGGIKVNPERIETIISKALNLHDFIVTWIPDDKLGQKLICLTTTDFDLSDLVATSLHLYERPKAILKIEELPVTANGKPDRATSQQLAAQLFSK